MLTVLFAARARIFSFVAKFLMPRCWGMNGSYLGSGTIQHESSASSEAHHANRCSNFGHPAIFAIAESCFRKVSGSFIKMSILFTSEEKHAKSIHWSMVAKEVSHWWGASLLYLSHMVRKKHMDNEWNLILLIPPFGGLKVKVIHRVIFSQHSLSHGQWCLRICPAGRESPVTGWCQSFPFFSREVFQK